MFIKETLVFLFLLFPLISSAQESNAELGDEYYQKGDFEKAIVYYENFLKEFDNPSPIYDHYYQSLINLKKYDLAEKRLKSFKKDFPFEMAYSIDLLLVYQLRGSKKEFEKGKEDFISKIQPEELFVESSARHLIQRKEFDFAEELFLKSRKYIGNPILYSQNLISLYQFSGKKIKMVSEGINLLNYAPGYLMYIENHFQDYLSDEEVSKALENEIIGKIQRDPESIVFSKLLVWFYVQKKDFKSAMVQAKSIDKRLGLNGKDLMDLGDIIFENKAYLEAIDLYSYISKQYSQSGLYPEAKRREITSREEFG